MLGDISIADNIYIVTGYTDMRKSIRKRGFITMSRQRRSFSAKFKSDLVIELLKGEKDLNTLAAENNIQPNLFPVTYPPYQFIIKILDFCLDN